MSNSKDIFDHIRRIQITTTRAVEDLFAGAYRSAFKGQGLEFEDVREYQPGDDIRHIDWNVSARLQHLYVKNFREERELTVMLVIDISASSQFSSSPRLKSEIIAEIGALLAFSAIKNQDRVGLLLFSNEIELYLSPKKGIRHVLRVIRDLLYFKPQHSGTDLKKALAFLGKVQKRHSICFLISDFLAPINQFEHESLLIAKRHDLIFLHVCDAHEENFPDLGLVHLKDLESGEMRLIDSANFTLQQSFRELAKERQQNLIRLTNQIRAGFISVSSHLSYIPPLRKFFKLRERKVR